MQGVAAAAGTYGQGVAQGADVWKAIAAGVQTRTALMRLDLAQEAQRSDDLTRMVQLSNEKALTQQKMKLAESDQQIAMFNARTNRMNAENAAKRVSAGTAGGSGGGFNIFQAMGQDEEGFYFDPSLMTQGPTNGEGDSDADFQPVPLQAPQGSPPGGTTQASPLGMPTGGGMGPINPLFPDPNTPAAGGAPPTAAPGTAPTGGPTAAPTTQATKPPRLRLSSMTVNSKGQPSFTFKGPEPGDAPGPQVTPQFLEALNKQYAHLGVMAVPDVGDKGQLTYNFIQKPSLTGDFSISSLPADTQKTLIEEVNQMVEMAAQVESPSDVEKMRAGGIVFPGDAEGRAPTPAEIQAAGQQAQDQGLDWSAAYRKVQKDKENALIEKASTYAKKLNAQFAGKSGYVPRSGIDVLREIGISALQPQQAAPAATPPTQPAAAGGNAPATQAPATSAAPAAAPSTPETRDESQQISRLEQEIAEEPDPAKRRQKELFLQVLKQRQPSASGARTAPSTAAAPPDDQDPWAAPAKKADAPAAPAANAKRDEAVKQWEDSKVKVVRALKSTLTDDQIRSLGEADPFSNPIQDRLVGSQDVDAKQKEWLAKVGDKLGIKAQDGKPLTLSSVVFVDHEGRGIKLREIMRAVYADPRLKASLSSKSKSQSGNSFSVTVGKPTEVK